jgi:hypothetical protein
LAYCSLSAQFVILHLSSRFHHAVAVFLLRCLAQCVWSDKSGNLPNYLTIAAMGQCWSVIIFAAVVDTRTRAHAQRAKCLLKLWLKELKEFVKTLFLLLFILRYQCTSIASNNRMTKEEKLEMIWRERVVAESKYYTGIYAEGLKKATKFLSLDGQCPGWDQTGRLLNTSLDFCRYTNTLGVKMLNC